MAYPFMPLKGRKLRKPNGEREDSDRFIEVAKRPIEFEIPITDPRCKTSPLPALSAKIAAKKISSQLWPSLSHQSIMIKPWSP
jgi:hypothetical protein